MVALMEVIFDETKWDRISPITESYPTYLIFFWLLFVSEIFLKKKIIYSTDINVKLGFQKITSMQNLNYIKIKLDIYIFELYLQVVAQYGHYYPILLYSFLTKNYKLYW